MSAQIFILPVVPRISPQDQAWREQFDRSLEAVHDAMRERPPRTRPILIAPLIVDQRPEGSR